METKKTKKTKKTKETYPNEILLMLGKTLKDARESYCPEERDNKDKKEETPEVKKIQNRKVKKFSIDKLASALTHKGIFISVDSIKKYEGGTRSGNIGRILELASFLDIDLEKFKQNISNSVNRQTKKEVNWKDCPVDIFIAIAIEFNIDLSELKNSL